ncbi:MAG: OmpA family protein [Oleibacter sp.]|nr:OmpA family protein [Thalassolituus sp.]
MSLFVGKRMALSVSLLVSINIAFINIAQADMSDVGGVLSYASAPETTRWGLSGNVFECRFEQPIKGYGRAVFSQKAGEDVSFHLETDRNLMAYSQANVGISPAPWQPGQQSEQLGNVKIQSDSPSIVLDNDRSNRFLHALLQGRWPTIYHSAFYDANKQVQVQVSAVSFQNAYRDYLSCINQLVSVNFDQVGRTKVFFNTGDEELDKADLTELNRVIYYIKQDPRINAIYLDGHTDNVGRRYDNRQMSKRRVELVEGYFLSQGINPEIITTRFHGGRYPVANNNTAAGRAANRRVTIRLEQDNTPLPSNLVFKLPKGSTALPPEALYSNSAQR